MNPMAITANIHESYLNYLTTTFRFKDPDLQEQFTQALRRGDSFVKPPILEATPEFVQGDSIEQLVRNGLLSQEFLKLRSEELPSSRVLWKHQQAAIEKIIRHDRNVVVATGTGSGKTEAFLVPILNHLFREVEQGTLGPGVRALLLYPMNALANDQLARLRSLLANYPRITFGRYTGETEHEQGTAESQYREMFGENPFLKNELISRERLQASPPHILLTNYAMLEYLLLRPRDSIFFDGKYGGNWRFVVLDEAHVYKGAKGIEIAMLLRRLKDRVVGGESGRLKCIATSATLGRGRDDFPQVADFASRLFGEPFLWEEAVSRQQDVVEAARVPFGAKTAGWGKGDAKIYQELRLALDDHSNAAKLNRLVEIAVKGGVPQQVLEQARIGGEKLGSSGFLYELLKGDNNLLWLRRKLEKEPVFVKELAEILFRAMPDSVEALVSLVDLANRARPEGRGQALLPARYHLFVRAIEGAYLYFSREKKLLLERHEQVSVDGRIYPVFEAASCRQCGAAYLVGVVEQHNGRAILRQTPALEHYPSYFLLTDGTVGELPVNEDDEVGFPEVTLSGAESEEYVLCGTCGAISGRNNLFPVCDCPGDNKHLVLKAKRSKRKSGVTICAACGRMNSSGLVWRFAVGSEAAASVLATSVYHSLKSSRPSGITDQVAVAAEKQNGRKLLAFSDSRQDAAFFAPYLQRTHDRILRRVLILAALKNHRQSAAVNRWRLQDLVGPLAETIKDAQLFSDYSRQQLLNEAWTWLMQEFLTLERRISLEGLGLLGFELCWPADAKPPDELLKPPWDLTSHEARIFIKGLIDTLRLSGAVTFPPSVYPTDEEFAPRSKNLFIREHQADRRRGILSWSSPALNARVDYFKRVADRVGLGKSDGEIRADLSRIWSSFLNLHGPSSPWRSLFSSAALRGAGVVYQLKHDFWELRSSLLQPDLAWYICDTCGTITLHNLRGVCSAYRCTGRLRKCNPPQVLGSNHYYRLYTGMEPMRMCVEEHTAQLTSHAAAQLQQKFTKGEVNILSCSTTFELGVDVGDLQAVFMRNMPPSAANYIQRAGRAGRRRDSVAFALTFAQRRSHDLVHYREPWRMVEGRIVAPAFKLENEKIIRRHVYATALSAFFKEKKNEYLFGTVDTFFFDRAGSGPELFKTFLERRPASLLASLQRIVPEALHGDLDLANWGWVAGLFNDEGGVLNVAAAEIKEDINELIRLRQERFEQGKSVDYLMRLIRTLKGRDIIGFLSSHNIIPKYGFPVDVVSLRLSHQGADAKRLQLERDLRIALSEYAPGSQVVAGGKLWTSRYLRRQPRKEWERFRYAICENCHVYLSGRFELTDKFKHCPVCGGAFGRTQGMFLIPAYGFASSRGEPGKPGDAKPERTYSTRVFYPRQSEKKEKSLVLPCNGVFLKATTVSGGVLGIINDAGRAMFRICPICGYAVTGSEPVPSSHQTPLGAPCTGSLFASSLGHEFETDVIKLNFAGWADHRFSFWISLLYALLEGLSGALDVERQDVDGCLYTSDNEPNNRVLVLFDDVPGGAGHVQRLAHPQALRGVLEEALYRLGLCDCGGESRDTSCYGCLRNYRNQYYHDNLERGMIIDFLEKILKL